MYHPFIPSITEELWQRNSQTNGESILDFDYPSSKNISTFMVRDFYILLVIIFTLIENSFFFVLKECLEMEKIKRVIGHTKLVLNNVLHLKQLIQSTERPKCNLKLLIVCKQNSKSEYLTC